MSSTRETDRDRSLLDEFVENLSRHAVTAEVVDRSDASAAIGSELVGATVGTEGAFEGIEAPDGVTVDPTAEEITSADTGVTAGIVGVAGYGSVVVPSTERWDGPVSLYPPKHVAVLRRSDVVPDIAIALSRLSDRFATGANDVVFVTGRSSTGDMGASVVGVHGPSEMHVVVIDE
ncbi:LUD domain-containing protein [Natronorarus salvus]|uniref:LUD domain-containing protein n=1 Tax=Natronorarus salvus TaxID=3117733 RepID=UPI002F26AC9F